MFNVNKSRASGRTFCVSNFAQTRPVASELQPDVRRLELREPFRVVGLRAADARVRAKRADVLADRLLDATIDTALARRLADPTELLRYPRAGMASKPQVR